MNYGKRQERAELLVKAFRHMMVTEPEGKFKGRSYEEWANEIERQTVDGRDLVYHAGLILKALATRPEISGVGV